MNIEDFCRRGIFHRQITHANTSYRVRKYGYRRAPRCTGTKPEQTRHLRGDRHNADGTGILRTNTAQYIQAADSRQTPDPVRATRTCVCHVAHGVLEGPDDGVEHELELRRVDGQEGVEAVRVDGLQQQEEVGAVLRVLLEVLRKRREMPLIKRPDRCTTQ